MRNKIFQNKVVRLLLIAQGALLGLKPSRIFGLVSLFFAPRRAKIIHPHGFTVHYRAFSLLIVLCSLLIINCKTTPDTVVQNLNFVPLDSGALAYAFINVKQARPILDLLPVKILNDKQTRRMIDKTSFCAAALFPKESTRLFQAAAWGNYPSLRAGVAFSFSKHWKKLKSAGGKYWHSSAYDLSLVLNSKQAFAASTPSYHVAAAPGVKTPEGFSEFGMRSPVSCWIENPAPLIFGILNEIGVPLQIPVRQLFINIYPAPGNQCEAIIRMQFENTAHARGMMALFNLTGNFSPDSILTKLLFSNTPVQSGNNVDIKTAVMDERDISLLFQMIFIYLN
jgi:hypothetical protein